MIKTIILSVLLSTVLPFWQDPAVNEYDRYPMRTSVNDAFEQRMSLNGLWDFRLSGKDWRKMPVPGIWELNGCYDPIYVNTGYAWRGHYENKPGVPPVENNYEGLYRKEITVPADWKGKDIFLCIGSATSCVEVRIDGKMVGYSEDSKLAATFCLTKCLKPGRKATLEFVIRRWCDGSYLEDQDFWKLTGIARDTYLYTRPLSRVEDVRIVAGADGAYKISAQSTKGVTTLKYFIGDKEVAAQGTYPFPRPWSAEEPNLYTLKVRALGSGNKVLDEVSLKFGFRTVSIDGKQLLVNGRPVLIKGTDRHELSPEGAYVVTKEQMIEDIRIMKRLNINAVRCCHYPDDPVWLELCDEYGLYVVDEANNESHGMGYDPRFTIANNPDYALSHLQRVQRMIQRDFNHPSVIVWSLGNEAGDGVNFEKCYNFAKAEDASRPVQYERAINAPYDKYGREGLNYHSDIFCPMYLGYEGSEEYAKNGEWPFIQCEYAHAMGNSMGGFKEYWDLVRKYPGYQGGFIWDFADQALKWPSDKSVTGYIYAFGGDFNKYDPSDNSFNCNGIVASDRSLHPHAYEVRHQYQDIWTTALDAKTGHLSVFNENFFKKLDDVDMLWDVTCNGRKVLLGCFDKISVEPQKSQEVLLGYDLSGFDGELFLNVRYVLDKARALQEAGEQVADQQIELGGTYVHSPKVQARPVCWKAGFDEKSGALNSIKINGQEMVSQPLMPCFGRAVTENDIGAWIQRKWECWLYPQFTLTSFVSDKNRTVAKYDVGDFAKVTMTYELDESGISVKEELSVVKEKVPNLFRVGVEMALDGDCDRLDFYGRGPWENYCDRKSSAAVGIYSQKVEDQYHYGYVRPQESGTHTDIRWMSLSRSNGKGLTFVPVQGYLSASALPFHRMVMDLSLGGGFRRDQKGDQRHSLELRPDGRTHLNIDLMQMGLGCVNSWKALPREEYLIHAGDYTFEFRIEPF